MPFVDQSRILYCRTLKHVSFASYKLTAIFNSAHIEDKFARIQLMMLFDGNAIMYVDAVSGICSCEFATADVCGNVTGGVEPVRSAMRNGIYTRVVTMHRCIAILGPAIRVSYRDPIIGILKKKKN